MPEYNNAGGCGQAAANETFELFKIAASIVGDSNYQITNSVNERYYKDDIVKRFRIIEQAWDQIKGASKN